MGTGTLRESIGERLAKAIAQDLESLAGVAANLARSRTAGQPLPDATVFGSVRETIRHIGTELASVGAAARAARQRQAERLGQALDARARWVEAYAQRKRSAVPARKDRFVLAGRIVDRATGAALPNLVVAVSDREKRAARAVASTRTNALGYFRIEFTQRQLEELAEKHAVIRVDVRDPAGGAIETVAGAITPKPGAVEFRETAVDGSKCAASLAQGLALRESVSLQLKRLAADRSRIDGRLGLFPGKGGATSAAAAARSAPSEAGQPAGGVRNASARQPAPGDAVGRTRAAASRRATRKKT
jgi:hypothetical protein